MHKKKIKDYKKMQKNLKEAMLTTNFPNFCLKQISNLLSSLKLRRTLRKQENIVQKTINTAFKSNFKSLNRILQEQNFVLNAT